MSVYSIRLTVCNNDETVVEDLYREAWQGDTNDYLRSANAAARDAAEAVARAAGLTVEYNTDSWFPNWHGGKYANRGPVPFDVVHDEAGVLADADAPANVLAVAKKAAFAASDAFGNDLEGSYRSTLASEIKHLANNLDDMNEWSDAALQKAAQWVREASGHRGTEELRDPSQKIMQKLLVIAILRNGDAK